MAATAAKAPPPAKVSATVRRWMKTLTLREEVAQLVFIEFHGGSPNTRSRDYQKFVRLIRDTNVGGLILINAANSRGVQKAEPYALATFLNRMQRLARVPLMVSADFVFEIRGVFEIIFEILNLVTIPREAVAYQQQTGGPWNGFQNQEHPSIESLHTKSGLRKPVIGRLK